MKKYLTLFLAAVLAVSAFAACTPAATSSAPPAAPSQAPAVSEPAEAGKDAKDVKVVYVSKLLGNQYMSVIQQGVEDSVKELGITDYTMTGTALDSEVEKQMQLLQDAESQNPDAILVCPTDSTALQKPIADIYNKGIPVILIDTIVDGDEYTAALLTNNYEAGKLCAETMIASLKDAGVAETEEAQVAIQIPSTGSQTVMDRVKGFNEYWDANAPEAWVVLNDDIKVSDGDISKAIGFTQDFITTYPKLKAMFGPANSSTVGFATGLKESGREDLILLGFDYSNEIADLIENSNLNVSTVLQRQYYMGYEGIKLAVEIAQGKNPAEKIVDTGVMVVNKANLNDADVQEIVNAGK
ncbi:substrate-binding domain-containing protein [Ruminococcaceae bacterium OttesenSCG-928-A16]|nr:substrate-binding domain-containing protein [Ruminococcaceae bacterium OttesenSCG-928-A16]